VQAARRWVVDVCADIGRGDLTECAELGVSELVTNALLHAQGPFDVRVRGTREHPRVEVRDASQEPPVLPGTDPHDDDLLLTFGRGLGIVARCSTAWGADIEDDGKAVWFVPADEPGEKMIQGVITGQPEAPAPRQPLAGDTAVRVVGVPLTTHQQFQRHYRELRREVRLLALAHEADHPLARTLSDLFGSLERDLRVNLGSDQVTMAQDDDREVTDVLVTVDAETVGRIGRFTELLDLADDFCRQSRMLSLARTPEQQRFQRWFLGEFVRQQSGGTPIPWREADEADRRSSVS
jgi:hypothetical protein